MEVPFVVPIPKGQPHSINNLRPISLTCVFAKVFEEFVTSWIMDDIGASLDKQQFGSLKGTSTDHCFIHLLDKVYKNTDCSKNSSVIVATDFSKAFDRVDHNILVTKFINLGVRKSIIPWVCSFLSNRTQAVLFQSNLSEWRAIHAGVPQGTKLGPVAFLAMINDAGSISPHVNHYKYVDDLTLCQSFQNVGQIIYTQSELDRLHEWAVDNNMKLNPNKCKAMTVSFKRNTPIYPQALCTNNSIVEQGNFLKILGDYIQNDLKWNLHINKMSISFNSRLYFLRQLKRCGVPIDDLVRVYVQYVRPSVEYASSVWHSGLTSAQIEHLEKLQKKALRTILSIDLSSHTSYQFICNKLNIETLKVRRDKLSFKFGKKLLNSSVYREWLPPCRLNNLRNSTHLAIPLCRTERYKKSPIPVLTKMLNNS